MEQGLALLNSYLRSVNFAELYRANNPEWKRQANVHDVFLITDFFGWVVWSED